MIFSANGETNYLGVEVWFNRHQGLVTVEKWDCGIKACGWKLSTRQLAMVGKCGSVAQHQAAFSTRMLVIVEA